MTPFDSLLVAAQEGAEWAWDRLYRGLAPRVRGYLVSQGAHDPDDLLGEVWLQVARNIGTFSGDEANFRSWVFMVAHNRVIDDRRARGRRPVDVVDPEASDDWAGATGSAEEAAMEGIETEEVLRVLATLPDDQRSVVAMRVLGDLTVDQVAQAIGKTPGAVKALQRRALRKMRKKVEMGVPL